MLVEIGRGHLVVPGWEQAENIDPVHGQGEFKRYAQDTPWPLADGTVERIRASHVMEHIPAFEGCREYGYRYPHIDVMNEAHRVLRIGGTFEVIVPGEYGTWHPIADPTHCSRWVLESFHYFDGLFAANASYGIAQWNTLHLAIEDGWEIHWLGEKP
jgi:hypothetical protein